MFRLWLMLRYWHFKASKEARMLYRLPYPGNSYKSLINRNLRALDIDMIEEGYSRLRDAEKLGIDRCFFLDKC